MTRLLYHEAVSVKYAPLMSHFDAVQELESWWSASWYKQSRFWLVWLCHLKTDPI